jgi:WW domain-containing oxidoreductase
MNRQQEIPRSDFGRRSTAEEVTAGLDLSGKNILITGCNSGLGFESMRVLSRRGAHIIGLSRNRQKAADAAAEVGADITPIACDLSDFESVVESTRQIEALERPIDVLMCNAGIMALPRLQHRYGLELQFVTNHLGHFILVNRLLHRLKQAAAGRVVMVSSLGHLTTVPGGINFDNLSGEQGYTPFTFYGQSKLANLLMSNELSRRLQGSTLTSNAIHPGVIMTPLMRNIGSLRAGLGKIVSLPFARSVQQGAATQCYVATAPALEGISGGYFANCNPAIMSIHAKKRDLARRLWDFSEEKTADYL